MLSEEPCIYFSLIFRNDVSLNGNKNVEKKIKKYIKKEKKVAIVLSQLHLLLP